MEKSSSMLIASAIYIGVIYLIVSALKGDQRIFKTPEDLEKKKRLEKQIKELKGFAKFVHIISMILLYIVYLVPITIFFLFILISLACS